MNHAQFYQHSKADQAVSNNNNNNNNNNVSCFPLKINKASHVIKKSSLNSLSSSSSLYNGIAGNTSTTTTVIPHHQQQPRHPVIIYTHSPKIIHTHPRDFMALVQKLTGLSPEDDFSSPPHPPRTTTMPQQHPKSEPINEELDHVDPISGTESYFEDIFRLDDQENNYMMNKKCDLLVNDDNECTSVVIDSPNINDNNSDFSNYNYNYNNFNDSSSLFDSYLAPLDPNPITNSSEYFSLNEQLCNCTDSLPFMPSMRNSYSSSSSESIKELSDF